MRTTHAICSMAALTALIGGVSVPAASARTATQTLVPASAPGEVVVFVDPTSAIGDERVEVIASPTAARTAAALDALPGVAASVDQPLQLMSDPYTYQQWQLTGAKVPSGARADGVTVAVVDTGVDGTHPDLAPALVAGYDAVSNTPMAPSTDNQWHGTFVAGVIGAVADNGQYGRGAAPGAKIMPIKVCSASGSCDLGDVAEGVVWAYQNGAKVINMSLGGAIGTSALEAAANAAVAAGAVVVAAAGNNGTSSMSYPAAYQQVIAVGSTDQNGSRSYFSQYGSWVELGAPGAGIVSTYPGSTMTTSSGTSFSSPMVAAAAALVIAQNPGATPTEVRNILLNSAAAGPAELGGKLLDVENALATAPNTPATSAPATTTTPTTAAPTTTIATLRTPGRPIARAATNGATVAWAAVPNATSYTVTATSGETITTSSLAATFSGLALDTPVAFSVRASATGAQSAASALSAYVTPFAAPDAPAKPTVVGGNRSAVVSWTAVARATSYVVYASTGFRRTVTSPATSATFTGLTNGVSATFTVVAKRGTLASAASESSDAVVPAGSPKLFGRPSALPLSDGRVIVSWLPPAANGAAVTSIQLVPSTGAPVTVTDATSYTFTGLTSGVAMNFTLQATNSVGTSSAVSGTITVRAGTFSVRAS